MLTEHLNTLAAWLGRRDVDDLTPDLVRADVLILFGGSPPEGWDVAARAMHAGAAGTLLLCGGAGHTTPMLRAALARRHPELVDDAATEADLMARYLAAVHGITGCLLERESTNSGNNITYAERALRAAGLTPASMILVQDASMQQRMDAVTRHVWTLGAPHVVNFAGTAPRVELRDGKLAYAGEQHWGAWDLDHCVTLLLGEVPRLSDTPGGYGPRGRGFLAHVDIPAEVLAAQEALLAAYGNRVRKADPRHAGPVH